MDKRLYFLLILLSINLLNVNAQIEQLDFEIIHKNKVVGSLITKKVITDSGTNYSSITELEIHILTKIKVNYTYDVSYINNFLNVGSVIVKVHGREKTNVRTVKENSRYSFYSDGKIVRNFDTIISNSVIQLFFEEPIGMNEIYAEEPGEFHKIEAIGNSYVKTAKSGHENIYTYKNGKLKRVDVRGGIVEFSMILKKD